MKAGTIFEILGCVGIFFAFWLNLGTAFKDFPLYFLCALLSLILIALGSILRAISQNPCDKKKK